MRSIDAVIDSLLRQYPEDTPERRVAIGNAIDEWALGERFRVGERGPETFIVREAG